MNPSGRIKAQVEEIAEAAGFSKGALYAHFKSKEDLFLALYETKTASYLTSLRSAMDSTPTSAGKIAAFRSFYIDLSREKDWALITPEVRMRLHQMDKHVDDSIDGAFIQFFGNSFRAVGEALGGIFSAFVLESDWNLMSFLSGK